MNLSIEHWVAYVLLLTTKQTNFMNITI